MEMQAEEGGEARCHLLVVVGCWLSFLSIVVFNYLCSTIRYSLVLYPRYISRACEGVESRVFFLNRVPT